MSIATKGDESVLRASEERTDAEKPTPRLRSVASIDLPAQFKSERDELLAVVERVFAAGQFVGAVGGRAFEADIAEFCGVEYAIGVASGTAALILSMRALEIGPGDEVITPPNSHFASTAAIVRVGARPVFVDVAPNQNIDPNLIEAAITPRTKAIMPVHLNGRIADMDGINDIAKRHALHVLEDAAQAIGAEYRGVRAGGLGKVGAFSAHPLKILNASGDAGFITTNDPEIALRLSRMRNLGMINRDIVEEWSEVSRLDVLQAEILRMRLAKVPAIIAKRRRFADLYRELIDPSRIRLPTEAEHERCVYHTFVIQVDGRDALRSYLEQRGITSLIHYPVALHLQPAAASLGYRVGDFPEAERQANQILSLPIQQFLSDDDIRYVAEAVNAWQKS